MRRGSPVAVDTGAKVVGKDTVVPEAALDPTGDRYGIDRSAEPQLREEIAEAKRRQAARKPKGRGVPIQLTMKSPEAGVREFEGLNPTLFDDKLTDVGDATRTSAQQQPTPQSVPTRRSPRWRRKPSASLAGGFANDPS